jgi:hypothetical protein
MGAIRNGMDQTALDHGYDVRASVPDYDAEVAQYRTRSLAARLSRRFEADLVPHCQRQAALPSRRCLDAAV